MTETCIYTEDGEECGAPATTKLDHPMYSGGACDEHEPRKHEGGHGCGGHIIKGECHCP